MIAARRLMPLADQFQIFGFLTEALLNFFAPRLQADLLFEQCSMSAARDAICALRAKMELFSPLIRPP